MKHEFEICAVEGCMNKVRIGEFCIYHYQSIQYRYTTIGNGKRALMKNLVLEATKNDG